MLILLVLHPSFAGNPYLGKKRAKSIENSLIDRGLDNQVSLHSLNHDEDANKNRRIVATHANYISACKFMHSDQQVIDEKSSVLNVSFAFSAINR